MFNTIQDFVINLLPSKRKQKPNGWITFNAVCCTHMGETQDIRGRGNVIPSPDGKITYSCFNCTFKTTYVPGRTLTFKFRKFLSWLGADYSDIKRLIIEAWRIKELVLPQADHEIEEEISFEPRELPGGAQHFFAWVSYYELANRTFDTNFVEAVHYSSRRKVNFEKYDFYWTPEEEHDLHNRVIIPFIYKNQIVGYTARSFVDNIKPKYYSSHPPHFVFNLNNQKPNAKFVVVCEGPFDAISIDGVSTQTNNISEPQADLIDSLAREVIVVPDFDRYVNDKGAVIWAGEQLINRALEYGWSVSFPEWAHSCKDINDAVIKYGKLFTLYSILRAKESNQLKIKLLTKQFAKA